MLPILGTDMNDDLMKGLIFLYGGDDRALPIYVHHPEQGCHPSTHFPQWTCLHCCQE